MKNRLIHARRSLGALSLAAAVAMAGCVETELQGVIVEDDIEDPNLMIPLVRGINSELHDNMRDFDGAWWVTGAGTDDFNNDGLAGSEERYTYRNYERRPGDFAWSQTHEAAWAGYYGVEILGRVFGVEEADRNALTARSWLIAGWAERMMGEQFCETVYNYGPGAGPLIGPNDQHDGGEIVPADSAFRRSITAMENAIRVGEAAVASGAPIPDGDTRIFDPQKIVYAAHGGIAQAAVMLGDWDLAVQHASQVPDDFILYSHSDPLVEDNAWYETSFQNDDFTLWNTPVHRVFTDDPRLPWIKCGEFVVVNADGDPLDENGDVIEDPDYPDDPRVVFEDRTIHTPDFRQIYRTGDCDRIEGKNFEHRAESNDMPLYGSLKSVEEGLLVRPGGETHDDADFPMVKGSEMRLIRAEAALLDNDLAGFKTHVDAGRAVYGMDPITLPTEAGSLEYPNAEDDAWSILDRERYAVLHMEGRRLADMKRWQHPYIAEQHAVNPRVEQENGAYRVAYCLPIAEIECDTNEALTCPAVGG